MKKIIIDCDNTFGVTDCDLDDGLAILYALGVGNCELMGVTTTFGNNTLAVVHENTVAFMKRIGYEQTRVVRGHENDASENLAAAFLADMAQRCRGELSILALGSLTNLHHAQRLDSSFFENVKELALMGGITQPLFINGKRLDELNLSCNAQAAYHVLTEGKSIKIATGNHCTQALFTRERFDRLGGEGSSFLRWLHGQAQYWFSREKQAFGHDGIYLWDVYAAAMMLSPGLFEENPQRLSPDISSLKTGMLLGSGACRTIALPRLKDTNDYIEHVCNAFASFGA